MASHTDLNQALHAALCVHAKSSSFLVAYSGGVDSHVLLHALSSLNLPVRAIHINHALSNNADAWEVHCKSVCDKLNVPFASIKVAVNPKKSESLEACARAARYGAILSHMQEDECVLTAQHQDDQAETLLLQMLRGAGPMGLSAMAGAMPFGTGLLLRPFLPISQDVISEYARAFKLEWIHDESNNDTRFARNALRHRVMPEIKAIAPSAVKTMARTASHLAQMQALLNEYAEDDLRVVMDGDGLSIEKLLLYSSARQKAIIRAWLCMLGLPLPSEVKLSHIFSDVVQAREDASPCVAWRGAEIRRYGGKLFALTALPEHDAHQQFVWFLAEPLTLPDSLGELHARPAQTGGLRVARDACVDIRFRQGGEVLVLPGRGRRTLKKCFQEWGVYPWMRDRVPLVYVNGTLALVVGHTVDQRFLAADGAPGVSISLSGGLRTSTLRARLRPTLES